MKQTIAVVFFSLFLISTGCSVYEDIYFLEDGKVKYNMTIDGADVMALAGSSSLKNNNNKFPKDSIINFAQIVRDTLDIIPQEIEQDLKNIEPLYMRVQNDDSLGILKISLYGDFDNMEAFTNAFTSMSKIEGQVKNRKGDNPMNKFSIDNLFNRNSFFWDGVTFKRTVTVEKNQDNEGDNADKRLEKNIDESVSRLFSQGQMVVKYHFPQKVKNVSNKDATFSMDGKTVILNYPASLFLKPDNELSIDIETE